MADLSKIKLNGVTYNFKDTVARNGIPGAMETGTGMFVPQSIQPAAVGDGSLLITEANNTTLGAKSLAVSTGIGVTLKQAAPANSTEYIVSNTYENRIRCAAAAGGVACINEANADKAVNIVSVTINGSSFTPSSEANSSANNIIIKLEETINPNNSISQIRLYPLELGFSNIYVGQCVGGSGGASAVVGQGCYNAGNASAVIGASMWNQGNGSSLFGRYHINFKNRVFLAGQGHDTTNAISEGVSALGSYSNITSKTLLAVGNGSSPINRSNAFEITTDGAIILADSNGIRWKITVDTTGNLIVAQA